MSKTLHTVSEVAQLICAGKALALAGDRQMLSQLPKGTWIGGSIPYFIGDTGGVCSRELIHVTEIPSRQVSVARYDARTISTVYQDGAKVGFSLIIIPAQSSTHFGFALRAPQFPLFAHKPLIGWIAGLHLSDLGKAKASVFDGTSGEEISDGPVVLHVQLEPDKVAEVSTINIFEMGDGPAIEFDQDGFQARPASMSRPPCRRICCWRRRACPSGMRNLGRMHRCRRCGDQPDTRCRFHGPMVSFRVYAQPDFGRVAPDAPHAMVAAIGTDAIPRSEVTMKINQKRTHAFACLSLLGIALGAATGCSNDNPSDSTPDLFTPAGMAAPLRIHGVLPAPVPSMGATLYSIDIKMSLGKDADLIKNAINDCRVTVSFAGEDLISNASLDNAQDVSPCRAGDKADDLGAFLVGTALKSGSLSFSINMNDVDDKVIARGSTGPLSVQPGGTVAQDLVATPVVPAP
jgi:hypothetical protein